MNHDSIHKKTGKPSSKGSHVQARGPNLIISPSLNTIEDILLNNFAQKADLCGSQMTLFHRNLSVRFLANG